MKPSSQRLATKPKKGASQAAAAATENAPIAAYGRTRGITGEKRERQTSVFVDFAASGVMAHDAVMKGVSGRALTRIWESTRGTPPRAVAA